ncbi:MAG TPA: hypothetical protein VKY34_06365 [Xanthomarina sp.]|nr:hypothetical protein [Xanthomarina sp.]
MKELSEKYFSNTLTEAEFQELEQALETDAAFRQEFYIELEIRQTIAQEKQHDLKERLKKLDSKPVPKTRWYLYAATITIFIAIGFFFFNAQPNYEEVYATHFEAYPNMVNLTNRSNNSQNEIAKEAFQLYDSGQFSKAAAAFEEVYKKHPLDYIHFYYGVSLMAAGNVAQGVEVLENHPWQENNNSFISSSHWYIGLGYVKLDKIPNARFYFKKVVEADNNLSAGAKEILKQLD